MSQNSAENRLAREKSPYLLQHARNPVDWHPWGEEAFTRARTERKPIFLSIGYSTCHWCHVMERESFEDEAIAAFLNEHFVPVKVDREERPDVDRVYMTALQAMGQGGGWPLSMFLTPDLRPFYGGTYYPPENRYGKIGFPELLRRIHEAWTAQQTNVEESAGKLAGFLREISSRGAGPEDVPGGLLGSCFGALRRTYDPVAGGFGGAPKFPRPVVFDVLLRYHRRTRAPEAVAMTLDTLKAMAAGGIADHLGGGFHRYAVDAEWRVPHFEKMLYDQAQIAAACLDAYLVTGDPGLADAARGTFAYVLRDLTHPEGGFFSAEDADSLRPGSDEEAEGAYYVWTRSEITGVLGEEEGARFCEAYGVEEEGNVPFDPQNEFTGRNILYRATDDAALAAAWGVTVGEVRARLSGSRERLRTARCERPRPHRDDKVLTSWNGLMIGAFARGFRVLGDDVFRDAAERAARFVRTRLARDGGAALLRRWRDGEARFDGQLDDYAFLAAGLLELHEATLEPEWLLWAAELAVAMEKLFWDDAQGGFFDTTGSDPTILARMKESYDGAEPSGNAVAAGVFARLAALTGDTGRRDKAERTLRFFARQLREQPHAMPRMIAVADFLADPPRQAVLAGQPSREDTASLLQLLHRRYDPNRIIVGVSGSPGDPLEALLPRGTHYPAVDGRGTLYVCENFTCALPTTDPAAAAGLLSD